MLRSPKRQCGPNCCIRKLHLSLSSVLAAAETNLIWEQDACIRRRRPTPATLFRVADQSSPEDDQSTHQWVVGENGVLKPKRVNPNVYQPPSLKAVQKMAEAHMQNLGVYPPLEDPCEGEEDEDHWQGEEGEDTSPTKAADHQETATTGQSDKFSSVRETAKQIQAAQEEEEEEEEEDDGEGDKIKETTEENSRGSN
ncbi:protein phosphatase 1 regulatory subunit 1B isoform X3 [Chaetodon trifascialis]|uniref:protein phosphatase 1 regulatory subunit 1B isoform X3 n=1 Tax=Chaetodon trifascialis TaxID=109706 RepID=UPI003995B415